MARHNTQNPSPTSSTKKPEQREGSTAPSAPRPGPTHEQIARRAFEIYQARGGTDGGSEHDWFQAERELRLGRQ